jgi:hypothetical protein
MEVLFRSELLMIILLGPRRTQALRLGIKVCCLDAPTLLAEFQTFKPKSIEAGYFKPEVHLAGLFQRVSFL